MQLEDLVAAANHAAAARREIELLSDSLERLHLSAEPSLVLLEQLFEKVALVNSLFEKLDHRQS